MVNFGTTSRLQMVTNTEKNVLMTISCPKDLRKAVLKIGNFVVSIFFIQSELRRNISTDELFDCYRHVLWSLGKVCAKKQSQTMNISRVISQNVSGQSYHTLAKVTGLYYNQLLDIGFSVMGQCLFPLNLLWKLDCWDSIQGLWAGDR